ncbi:MAG: XdhC family protein, partial [Desulfatiglandales bacterium]|nr:XdhC family protein [Desulfatiglandales bacterium]
HHHDKTVMEKIMTRPTRYIGMIGNRRKRNMIYDALRKQGIEDERVKQVHSPIGLNIGAETPEEIAISIAAELVQVRAEGLRMVKDWEV